MSADVSLQPITPFHAEVLATLHKACFDEPWTASAFQALLQNPVHKGFVCDKGFILYATVADEAEILTFCVLPAFRRQGIGRALLQAVLDTSARVFLEVRENNHPARRLYQKMGFGITGRRKGYYKTAQGTCDALCYAWPVEPNP